jgi:hypothetical protein
MGEEAYTRKEVLRLGNVLPDRGPLCPRCDVHIPQFAELTGEEEERLKVLIRGKRSVEAMMDLRRLTGCSIGWAKIWVLHPNGPNAEGAEIAPCPYCGAPLRTKRAKQCRHCKRDWHDSEVATPLESNRA